MTDSGTQSSACPPRCRPLHDSQSALERHARHSLWRSVPARRNRLCGSGPFWYGCGLAHCEPVAARLTNGIGAQLPAPAVVMLVFLVSRLSMRPSRLLSLIIRQRPSVGSTETTSDQSTSVSSVQSAQLRGRDESEEERMLTRFESSRPTLLQHALRQIVRPTA